ncbi:serine acetyltransferase, partial [bacterium]|nr:serine acetyltransferase [bacterium]
MSVHREQRLLDLTTAILASYHEHGHLSRADRADLPSRDTIWAVVEEILRLLFPGFLEATEARNVGIHERTAERVRTIDFHLRAEIEKGLRFAAHEDGRPCDAAHLAATATTDLLARIPAIRDLLASDIQAAHDGDPAARSHEEIILAYPGLQAIAVYRVAHALHEDGIPIVPRVMTEYAHSRTGIDIHPGATIGRRFFIDHGTGVVIG